MRRVSTIAMYISRTYSSCSIALLVLSILITFLPGIDGNGTTLTMSPTRKTTTISLSSGSIRLVGSNHFFQGVVEVLIDGSWGAICANNLFEGKGNTFAEVACRQLGYNKTDGTASKAVKSYGSAYEVPDYSSWFFDDLRCQGSEDRLQDCNYLSQYDSTGCPDPWYDPDSRNSNQFGDTIPTAGVASVKCYNGDWARIENEGLYNLLSLIVILLFIGIAIACCVRRRRQRRLLQQQRGTTQVVYAPQPQTNQYPGTQYSSVPQATPYPPPAGAQHPPPSGAQYPPQAGAQYPPPAGTQYPPPAGAQYPPPAGTQYPPPAGAQYPPPAGGQYPPPAGGQYPPPAGAQYPPPAGTQYPPPADAQYPPPAGTQYPPPAGAQYPPGAYPPPQAGI